jgi:hypothetical protein
MSETETIDRHATVQKLLAERRRFCTHYEVGIDGPNADRNEDGDLILERGVAGPGSVVEGDINLSAVFGPAPSTTGNVELLRIEAELHAEGRGGENPHVPVNGDVLAEAKAAIERDGHTPAWEDVE